MPRPIARSPEAIAAELAASPGLDAGELVADEPARWTELVSRAWPPAPSVRSRLWAGGPVPSNRFDRLGWCYASAVKKILVVEDDPVNQMILTDFLAANGYETVAASTGPEGIERFERDAPDLCLVDVQLPRINGFELAREMKSRAPTPILLMSAVYSDAHQSTRTIQIGAIADGYLSKPFDLVQLLAQVRELLGEA